jgi:hypothetical protein
MQLEVPMTNTIPRLAATVFSALFAVAVLSVSTAHAEDEKPLSTACGAGTLNPCGEAAETECDWSVDIGHSGGWSFHVKVSKSNCRVVGHIPIYKDIDSSSVKSGSCNLLNPFLGMPAGTGCSEV